MIALAPPPLEQLYFLGSHVALSTCPRLTLLSALQLRAHSAQGGLDSNLAAAVQLHEALVVAAHVLRGEVIHLLLRGFCHEGRSLRNAGGEARLGASLQGTDSAMLLRTLLPRAPIDPIDTSASPGAVVAAAMLDPAYQLK